VGTDQRLRRLLQLGEALIDAPRGLSLEQYGKKHGYSRSALYRDVAVLRDVGFPITSDRGRHRVAADFQLFGRRGLDAGELLALFVARQVAGRIPGSRFDRALASVWAKVTGVDGQLALVPGADDALSVSAFQTLDYTPHRAVIDTLESAIHGRVAVKLRYRKASSGEVSERVVEPGQLHADAAVEGLFLIAYCRWRRAVRVFAIQRVVSAEPTGEHFTPRAETRSRVALRDAFRVWVGKQDAPVNVRVRFARSIASEIAERHWHSSQVLTQVPGGEVVLELRVGDPASLIRWLMGYGADVIEVEEPRWLAEEVRRRHRRAGGLPDAARIYRSQRGRPSTSRTARAR